MNTNEILKKLKGNKNFLGVFPSDFLPEIKHNNYKQSVLIANTDPSTSPGTQWVSIVVNSDQSGEYFDPFGFPPLTESFTKFLEKNCPAGWCFNTRCIQHPFSETCGKYCVAFARWRLKGLAFETFVCAFSDNLKANEAFIEGI